MAAPPPRPDLEDLTFPQFDAALAAAKARKFERLRPLLRADLPHRETAWHFDYLPDTLRQEHGVTDAGSAAVNQYDPVAQEMIAAAAAAGGLVLDCGAGRQARYRDNVVYVEIAPYESTDVMAVGEALPFVDGCFDAVFSLNVLEHVRDPFRCAAEIVRVMKPGARLYCVVPFLQPLHGYPHHYFNMSHQGLRRLFEDGLTIDEQQTPLSGLPIYTLTWMLGSWLDGLDGPTRETFLNLRVSDLLRSPITYQDEPFVAGLPPAKNLELASTTMLLATKPGGTA